MFLCFQRATEYLEYSESTNGIVFAAVQPILVCRIIVWESARKNVLEPSKYIMRRVLIRVITKDFNINRRHNTNKLIEKLKLLTLGKFQNKLSIMKIYNIKKEFEFHNKHNARREN